jgi:hypothetical protein
MRRLLCLVVWACQELLWAGIDDLLRVEANSSTLEGPRRPAGGEQSPLSLQLGVLPTLRAELAIGSVYGRNGY